MPLADIGIFEKNVRFFFVEVLNRKGSEKLMRNSFHSTNQKFAQPTNELSRLLDF